MLTVDRGEIAVAGAIENIHVPETLQGVLAARIDRLAPEKKQTLQNASVIGRIFQERVLAHMYEESAARNGHLDDSLAELSSANLSSGENPPKSANIFSNTPSRTMSPTTVF